MGSRQIIQCFQSLFRLALLHDAHDSVEHHDQQNEHRFKEFFRISLHAGDGKGDSRGRQQDQNHHIFELGKKPLKKCFFLFLLQFVFPKASQPVLHLLCVQTIDGVGIQRAYGLSR